MRHVLIVLAVLLAPAIHAPRPLAAQSECTAAGYTGSAGRTCQTFVDAVRIFHPLAGMIVSGGNPVLGTAETLHGPGHVALSARVNAIKASVPNPDSAGRTSVPSSFNGLLPAPVVEAAVGIVRGLPTGVLSVDALGSATLLPTHAIAGLSVDSSATHLGSLALGLGYGVRIALLRGGIALPSVSVSVMRRSLPRIQYAATAAGDSAQFATDLHATNVRVAVGMRFVLFEVAAGLGWDRYTSAAQVSFLDPTRPLTNPQRIALDLHTTRGLLFVNAGVALGFGRLVGELGYQAGKDEHLTTNFTGATPKAGHVFGGGGLRIAF